LLHVGNDIVDLIATDVGGKSQDKRFTDRVFCLSEQHIISTAALPDRALWALWAAKESAYKIYAKRTSNPAFSHRKFVCRPRTAGDFSRKKQVSLTVDCPGDLSVDIQLELYDSNIHACGTACSDVKSARHWMLNGIEKIDPRVADSMTDPGLTQQFSAAERPSIKTFQSAQVRVALKRALAVHLKVDAAQLQIIRPSHKGKPRPPYLLIDDQPSLIDISLSHHGRWVAWCAGGESDQSGAELQSKIE
jgi:phosphopantetheinyl transferase (holo-ACP synthase)